MTRWGRSEFEAMRAMGEDEARAKLDTLVRCVGAKAVWAALHGFAYGMTFYSDAAEESPAAAFIGDRVVGIQEGFYDAECRYNHGTESAVVPEEKR